MTDEEHAAEAEPARAAATTGVEDFIVNECGAAVKSDYSWKAWVSDLKRKALDGAGNWDISTIWDDREDQPHHNATDQHMDRDH